MATVSITRTWTQGKSSASATFTATYTLDSTTNLTRITLELTDVDLTTSQKLGANTTTEQNNLAVAKQNRDNALANGLTISFNLNGRDGDNVELWSGSTAAMAFSKKTYYWNRTHSAQTPYVWVRMSGVSHVAQKITVPAKPSYSVTYRANGGSGSTSAQTKWYGENLTLNDNKFTRSGYNFKHWNTNTTDTGSTYEAKAVYTGNAILTLNAIWNPIITYNPNEGTGSVVTQNKIFGQPIRISANKFTRSGYSFRRWNKNTSDTDSIYYPDDSYTDNVALTLYAIWDARVVYDSNGGVGTVPPVGLKHVNTNLTLADSTSLSKEDYRFKQWNTAKNGSGTAYPAKGTYTSDTPLTLYAIWQQIYAAPVLQVLDLYRSNSDGNEVDEGDHFSIKINWQIFSTVNDNENQAKLTIEYNEIGSSSEYQSLSSNPIILDSTGIEPNNNFIKKTETLTFNNQFDSNKSYNIRITLSDNGSKNDSIIKVLSTAFFPIDISQAGQTMALGGSAKDFDSNSTSEKVLDIYYNTNFYGKTSLFSTFNESENIDTGISQNGVYYITSAVLNRPKKGLVTATANSQPDVTESDGVFLINRSDANTGCGLYLPNDPDNPSLYKITIKNGAWKYQTLTGPFTRITDCNNATDPNVTYYTNGDSTNLNRPVNSWSVVKNLFLNGNPSSGNQFSLCQIGMSMNSSMPPNIYGRTKAVNGNWSSWYPFSKTLWKSVNETRSTAAGNTTVTLTTTFPAKSGFTRQLMGISTNSSNAIVAGWYIDSDDKTIKLRVRNLYSSAFNVTYHVIYMYLDDSCIW